MNLFSISINGVSMSNESFYNNKKSLGLLFSSLSLILFLFVIAYALFKPGIGYDDYYTLGIIRLPLMDMISATAVNVHPPLYYIILKVFSKIFNPLDNQSLVLLGKIVSLIPIALILAVSFTKIKKEFGLLAAGLFSFLIVSSFNVMVYSTVIRMYSWGLFFITIQLIYLYDIIHRKDTKIAWIVFTIASICSTYTHYFSAIASIIIYLVLFAYLLHSNRKELKKWIVSTIVSLVAYLPWMGILLSQVSTVSDHYWIKPIGFDTVISYIDFIFSPSVGIIGRILEIFLIVLLIALVYLSLKNKKSSDDYVNFSLISMSIIFLTMIAGIVLSFLIRPIFVSRYILPCFGGLWLGVAILLAKCFDNRNRSKTSYDFDTRKVFYFGILLILIVSAFSAMSFIGTSSADYNETLGHYQFFDSINDGRTVIFDDELSYLRYSPYLDRDNCVLDTHLKSTDKYGGGDTVIFVKINFDKIEKSNYHCKKIFEIYQDEVYSFA